MSLFQASRCIIAVRVLIGLVCLDTVATSIQAEEKIIKWRYRAFGLTEKGYFNLLREHAGPLQPLQSTAVPGLESIEATMPDGTVLKGYRLKATTNGIAKGALLAFPGNAQLCDRLIPELESIRSAGIDVFAFDYRGLGNSGGKSTFSAIFADSRELLSRFETNGSQRKYLLGISFGGFVLLNALNASNRYDGIIIDSTPANVSTALYDRVQPTSRLPTLCSNFFLISGQQDTIVKPQRMKKLLHLAEERGAKIWTPATLGHPFDPERQVENLERLAKIREFIERTHGKQFVTSSKSSETNDPPPTK